MSKKKSAVGRRIIQICKEFIGAFSISSLMIVSALILIAVLYIDYFDIPSKIVSLCPLNILVICFIVLCISRISSIYSYFIIFCEDETVALST